MQDNDFFSIDKFVEFGMGMSIAQQMVRTMNQTMQNMYVPGAMNPMQQTGTTPQNLPQPQVFYAIIEGNSVGPLSDAEVIRLMADKRITKDTLVWKPGMKEWQPVERTPEVLKLVLLTPPAMPQR